MSLVMLSWWCLSVALALPDALSPRRLVSQQWTTDDGLLQNSITDIYQDPDGYLWMTTFGGLCRFDGVRFSCFDLAAGGLPQNRLLVVTGSEDGTLWLGAHDGGLLRYRDGQFAAIPVSPAVDTQIVHDIQVSPEGVVWAATSSGLVRHHEGDTQLLQVADGLPCDNLRALHLDEDGTLWIGGSCGLSRLRAGQHEKVWSDNPVDVIQPDGQGGLWLSVLGDLVHLKDGQEIARVALGVDWTQAASRDDRGRLWVCGTNGQTGWVDDAGFHPVVLSEDGLKCRAAFVDRDGSLWLGTDPRGVFQIRDRHMEILGTADGLLAGSKNAVLVDPGGEVWIGSNGGLERWRAGEGSAEVLLGEARASVRALLLDAEGRLLIGLGSQVRRLGPGGVDEVLLDDLPGDVHALLEGPDGMLWVGTNSTVMRWLPGTSGPQPIPGLESVAVNVIRADGDDVLLGGQAGVSRWRPDGSITRYTTETLPGFPGGVVRDLLVEEDGGVWIGSYGGGLAYLKGEQIVSLTTEEGLAENVVSRILDDGRGRLWLHGNRGISSVRRDRLREVIRGEEAHVHAILYEGIEANGGSGDAGALSDAGVLWLPTILGLERLSLNEVDIDLALREPPRVLIEQATLSGIPLAEGTAVPPMLRRDLMVQYSAPVFLFPSETIFEHRLVGYDAEWHASGDRLVSYTNLSPGAYRLELRAQDNVGLWSDTVGLEFVLQPSLWERRWFRLLVEALGGAVLLALIGRRLWVSRQQNRRLEAEILRRHLSEEALRERENRYRAVFEGVADALIVYDSQGMVLTLNPAGACILQLESVKHNLHALDIPAMLEVPEERAAFQRHLTAALVESTHGSGEALLRRREDTVLVRYTAVPFPLSGSHGALVSVADITELRHAEAMRLEMQERIQRAQTIEALGQLAGGVAHDFNNLLTVISTSAGLILEGEPADALAQDILACSGRGAELVRRLLVAGQRQPYHPAPVPIRALLSSLDRVFRSMMRDDIVLKIELPPDTLSALTDAAQLERAMLNLAINARDAMPRGGTLWVQATREHLRPDQREAISDPLARAGDFVVISVRDSGTGISPEIQGRIFEPFFTTKPTGQGTGLGLSVVHSVVHRSEGFLDVESDSSGSCFRLFLPVAEHLPTPTAPPPGPLPDLEGVVILVCDDQPDVLSSTVRMLLRWRATVISSSLPEEALHLAETHRDTLSLLITDVVMPVMKGPELAHRVRQLRPGLPVLFISGYTRDTPTLDGPLLEKPFTPLSLGDSIRKLLRRS